VIRLGWNWVLSALIIRNNSISGNNSLKCSKKREENPHPPIGKSFYYQKIINIIHIQGFRTANIMVYKLLYILPVNRIVEMAASTTGERS
jgi:hypothetical protein